MLCIAVFFSGLRKEIKTVQFTIKRAEKLRQDLIHAASNSVSDRNDSISNEENVGARSSPGKTGSARCRNKPSGRCASRLLPLSRDIDSIKNCGESANSKNLTSNNGLTEIVNDNASYDKCTSPKGIPENFQHRYTLSRTHQRTSKAFPRYFLRETMNENQLSGHGKNIVSAIHQETDFISSYYGDHNLDTNMNFKFCFEENVTSQDSESSTTSDVYSQRRHLRWLAEALGEENDDDKDGSDDSFSEVDSYLDNKSRSPSEHQPPNFQSADHSSTGIFGPLVMRYINLY